MEEKILAILQRLHPEITLDESVRLVDDGVLDSLDIVTLVTELNVTFSLTIPAVEIIPDHFNSVRALAALLERLDDV